jgi:hypothetical protein
MRQLRILHLSFLLVLCSCSSRSSRTSREIQDGPKYEPLTLRSIPHHTEAEVDLNEYIQHYQQFRNVMKLSSVQIREQAMLAKDYEDARRTFNDWLHFVTDTIEQQSDLEREGAPAEFLYTNRADAATVAIRKLDADLQRFDTVEPSQTSNPQTSGEMPLYDLGRLLRKTYDRLNSDDARIASVDLFERYSWPYQ